MSLYLAYLQHYHLHESIENLLTSLPFAATDCKDLLLLVQHTSKPRQYISPILAAPEHHARNDAAIAQCRTCSEFQMTCHDGAPAAEGLNEPSLFG